MEFWIWTTLCAVNTPGHWAPPWIPPLIEDISNVGECLFLSDLHLGAGPNQESRMRDLASLFASLPGSIDDLVLAGDIFEFWWEWKEAVPRRHLAFLDMLRVVAAQGVRLRLVAGNHDFAVGGFLAGHLPALVHPDGYLLQCGQARWLVVHGDGMAPSDRLDRGVRRVLRSRIAQMLWNLLPPDFAFGVAGGVGKASRQIQPGPAPNVEEYSLVARDWMRRWNLQGVVHGHTHRPLLERGEAGTYINNGDWVLQRSLVWLRPDGSSHLVDCRKDGHPWLSNT